MGSLEYTKGAPADCPYDMVREEVGPELTEDGGGSDSDPEPLTDVWS